MSFVIGFSLSSFPLLFLKADYFNVFAPDHSILNLQHFSKCSPLCTILVFKSKDEVIKMTDFSKTLFEFLDNLRRYLMVSAFHG